jgi:hypothetical protein
MTDGGAAFQSGTEEARVPFRPRGTYAGYRAFGSGNGAVLIDPKVTRELRTAAEFATQERRITGGLLYGRGWADEQGVYLVIDGYLEAGPGENSDDRIDDEGYDRFTLSSADLRLLREDASRMYSSDVEAGWWRSLAGLGEFGPQDFETQAELVGPGGVGLLVYGSSVHWGTAYLGPDSQAPDSAGTLAATPAPATPAPATPRGPEPQAGPAAGHVPREEAADSAAGEILAPHPQPAGPGPAPAAQAVPPASAQAAPPPAPQAGPPPQAPPRARPTRRRAAPVRVAARRWVARPTGPDQGPETPGDVKFVVGALVAVAVAVAIIIGVLVHSALVAVIIAVVAFVVILSTVWFSRR